MVRWALALACSALIACSFTTNTDTLRGDGGAGGADGAADAPLPLTGFSLSVSPEHVISDKGEPHGVTVTLVRANGFTDPVNAAINGDDPKAQLSNKAPVLFAGTTVTLPLSFTVGATATETPVDGTPYTIEIAGQSGAFTAKTKFYLHVGTLIGSYSKSGAVTLPAYATSIDMKVWGAGGGGSTHDGAMNPSYGAKGGGAGFLSGTIDIPGGTTLDITVGTGGGAPSNGGGGGGGYSAIRIGTDDVAVAGGGGGGGFAGAEGTAGHTNGGIGCNGKSATLSAGGPGTGGGGAGALRMGGAGSGSVKSSGGAPGGGAGGTGGGGGGGYWGGGGGGTCGAGPVGGGGGGGAFARPDTKNPSVQAGNGQDPGGLNDPERGGVAGRGGEAGAMGNVKPTSGEPGRVVIRLTKTP